MHSGGLYCGCYVTRICSVLKKAKQEDDSYTAHATSYNQDGTAYNAKVLHSL